MAYALPAGHRLRLALSTSYWPWLWPSPEPATLTISTGGASRLTVPVRAPRAADDDLLVFGPPETAPPLPVTRLRQRRPAQTVWHDHVTGVVAYEMSRDFSGAQRMPSGLEYDDRDPVTFTIREGDPLSAKVACHRRVEILRGDWRTRVELRSEMTADANDYLVSSTIDAYEGDTRIHSRTLHLHDPAQPHVIAKRLDNIDVICTDVEPMRAFYGDLLGLPLRLPYEEGQGWVGFRAGDVVIYLIEESGPRPPHRPAAIHGRKKPPGDRLLRLRGRRPRRGDR